MDRAFCVCLGLGIANFVWQAAAGQEWAIAMDRSYWQLVACLTMAFVARNDARRVGVA